MIRKELLMCLQLDVGCVQSYNVKGLLNYFGSYFEVMVTILIYS